ncbi:nucleotidyl transferase [Candidatus Woesearchaeota archaeon]|nr:MAG: nucleotidyl transferase [Candidatus Woesearchaeota archaeon]
MKAILPVAGVGTRLKPHTYTIAKVLINVAGKPILGHILDKIRDMGINEAVLIIGYLGDQIKDYVTKNYPDMKFYFAEQPERKGLGHAILLAEPFVNNEPALIIYGDTIFIGEFKSALKTPYDGAIGVKMVDDPRRWGVIEMNGEFAARLVEKPDYIRPMPAIVGVNVIRNTKLMFECLNELIEKDIRTKGEYQLTDAFQLMVDKGARLTTFPVEGWYDCGKPETLLETNRFLLDKHGGHSKKRDGVVIIPPVYIHDSAKIYHSIIGPHVTIDKDAVIVNSIIHNSIINSSAEIRNEILKDSLIGDFARVEGHFKVLNVGDSSEVNIK